VASVNAEWLGTDLKSWSQSIRNGYIRAFIVFALHETGVFDALKRRGGWTAQDLATECQVDPQLLEGTLNFLAHADRVIEKTDGRFSMGEHGDWLFSDQVLTMSFGAVGGYASLLFNLVDTLKGRKRYGRDFIRPGDLIAKGSYYTGKSNYPWVVSQLSQLGARVVADLGCGSGDVVIAFCKLDPSLRGVGIDIAPAALEEASRRAEDAGVAGRIRWLLGDVQRPETWSAKAADVQAFNAIMVIHEFLRDGEEAVVEMFRKMKEQFPGRHFLMGEFDRVSDEEYERMPYPDRIHPLFYQEIIHPHTWQGLPITKGAWLRIFERAGVQVVTIKEDFPFRLVEFVVRF
jgi:SAM-dependent methyltransferase